MIAKVQLVLNEIVNTKKREDLPIIERIQKYTIFERAVEFINSGDDKENNKHKFRPSNKSVKLYFPYVIVARWRRCLSWSYFMLKI